MDKFVITGGNKLCGEVTVGGAKNAALPLITASLLVRGQSRIFNVQPLTDIRTICRLLNILGAECSVGDDMVIVDTSGLKNYEAPYKLVKTMRASIYVLGPLLAHFGRARISLPGGCAWGPRPVNLHIEGMRKLGAEVALEGGYIIARARRLRGANIDLDFPSVGATGNILMAAVAAKGETVINNAAREPDISALAEFLQKMGARIEGIGTSTLHIQGVDELHSCDFNNIPDRIEAGTFMVASAITAGDVKLNHCRPDHCQAALQKLQIAGCDIEQGVDWVRVRRDGDIQPVNVTTEVYPGYPTDLQAQWIALMSLAKGTSWVIETIYKDRFTHVAELARLGAEITMKDSTAMVKGVGKLKGAPVMSTDIRASASLILAGLAAEGRTDVTRIYHIDRGYYRIEDKLVQLGADIHRERDE
ncbi:MAG: UDP-N-acetylglucosamine 1-carboxyvinyltransferase [candidate division Zixibacteria bacterium]|nr:UDP-N-acetylglucosamine 1-carboxyvinyltransferase [Candidatus Tariuqbacter arcticus]